MMPNDRHDEAAALLLATRRGRRWLSAMPEACRPKDIDDAYAIQKLVLSELGPIAAWKVGAGSPEARPACAAIAQATLFETGAKLPANMFHLIGVEAEIAYRFVADLPAKDAPYPLEKVLAAIGSIHPAIEVSDTRFTAWASQDRFSHVADQLNHGALVVGPGREDWRGIDAKTQSMVLTINDEISADVVGGNPAGDPLRLILWLANEGARPFGGLRAGSIITTGSLTGVKFMAAPVRAQARAAGIGTVDVAIG
jgi:2-keto-4-pentenoate hydratase